MVVVVWIVKILAKVCKDVLASLDARSYLLTWSLRVFIGGEAIDYRFGNQFRTWSITTVYVDIVTSEHNTTKSQ